MLATKFTLALDRNEGAYVPDELRTEMHVKTEAVKRLKSRRKLHYVHKNGYNDPLSTTFLLDLLSRIDSRQPIRANVLAHTLDRQYPQILWDAYTVGRMMGNLQAYCRLSGNRYLEDGRDWLGRYWVIEPTKESQQFLLNLLDDVGALAEEAVADNRKGRRPDRMGDPLTLAAETAATARAYA